MPPLSRSELLWREREEVRQQISSSEGTFRSSDITAVWDEDEDIITDVTPMIDLKKMHLNRDMRSVLHRPKSDWFETPRGEVCKNACSLVVDDIIGVEKK